MLTHSPSQKLKKLGPQKTLEITGTEIKNAVSVAAVTEACSETSQKFSTERQQWFRRSLRDCKLVPMYNTLSYAA
jgi:hypothetical protein